MRFIVGRWSMWANRIMMPMAATMQSSHGSLAFAHAVRHTLSRGRGRAATARAVSVFWYYLQLLLLSIPAAIVAFFRAYDDFVALLCSLPRTMRTITWAVRAGTAYKKFEAQHKGEEVEGEEYQVALGEVHAHWGAKLAEVCRANGGVYVKAGQFASTFGAVPAEIRAQLSQLEDKARPRPYSIIRNVLISELGLGAETLFSHFEDKATAAASIAQVHRARLITGEEVAVKLQYPGLKAMVGADLSTMKALSRLASWFFPKHQLGWVIEEIDRKMQMELDFRTELTNATRLESILLEAGIRSVHVPFMYKQYCTPRIIVMEWIQGTKITDVGELNRQAIKPRCVGIALMKLFAELTFRHGYVHGDPHAGNLMVRATGKRSFFNWLFRGSPRPFEIVLLDHGTYLTIPQELRETFCQLWCALVARDKRTQRDLCVKMGGEQGPAVLPLLLTHQCKDAREMRALQRKVGVTGFSDIAAMLASASNDLVELLRINTVIRAVTRPLDISMRDRVRIYAGYARGGLPPPRTRASHIHERFHSAAFRLNIAATLVLWDMYTFVDGTARRSWGLVLSILGEALFG